MKNLKNSNLSNLESVHPNAVQEGDFIEAHFPCGSIERGIAVREEKLDYHCWYQNKRRMMLCADGESRGHVITGLAGFPDGTEFYRVICTANKAE